MCSLRDAATDFAKHSIQVYGISRDDVAAQAAFAKSQKLEFPLLSDPDGSVVGKYGVAMQGRPFAQRVTFVVDDQGVLRAIDEKVDVAAHGAALVALVDKLRRE